MSEDRLTTRDIARNMQNAAAETADRVEAGTEAAVQERERAHDRAMMFQGDEAAGFRTQWDAIQTGFVDEPRKAVEEADALVAQVIKRLSEVFADERTNLEHQWGRGSEVSTEDLRQSLRKYRSFFERLLSM
jgi:alpha-D-ribose 1-methylphosphonate 5-triphosphate diphosphatase PhnM